MAHQALTAKLLETHEKILKIDLDSVSTPDEEEFEKDVKEMKELMSFHDKNNLDDRAVQSIELQGKDKYGHASLYGYEVNIHSSPSTSRQANQFSASSKVTVTSLTSHNFDANDAGANQMVACNTQFVAYVLEGRSGHVLRIMDQSNGNRGLLKEFVGSVVDVSFAHFTSNILACVDQGGNVYVWKVTEVDNKLVGTTVIQIMYSSAPESVCRRLVFCPHIASPDQLVNEDEDDALLLAVSFGSEVEVLDVGLICDLQESRVVKRAYITEGIKTIHEGHSGLDVHDIALAPDGNVIATAGGDGNVRFWDVTFDKTDSSPNFAKSLHHWTPHEGAPVTRLLFCDDQLNPNPSSQTFWRFLITSAEDNSTVKIWCTIKWTCLQSITFLPPLSSMNDTKPKLLLNLDLSSQYCVIADATRLVLYVLQLQCDVLMGQASFTSIREYMLAQPVLSFVLSGPVRPVADDSFGLDQDQDPILSPSLEDKDDGFDNRREVVKIRIHAVQPKSVRELCIQHEPHDFLTLPPPLQSERELDRRFDRLLAESEQERSTDLGEEMLINFAETSDELDPLNPALTPRPLLPVASNHLQSHQKGGKEEEGPVDQQPSLGVGVSESGDQQVDNQGESPSQSDVTGRRVASFSKSESSTLSSLTEPMQCSDDVVQNDYETSLTSVTPTSTQLVSSDFADSQHQLEVGGSTTLSAAEQSLHSIQQLLGISPSPASSHVSSSHSVMEHFSQFEKAVGTPPAGQGHSTTSDRSSVTEDIPSTSELDSAGVGTTESASAEVVAPRDQMQHVSSTKGEELDDDSDRTPSSGEETPDGGDFEEWPDVTDSDDATRRLPLLIDNRQEVHSNSTPVSTTVQSTTPGRGEDFANLQQPVVGTDGVVVFSVEEGVKEVEPAFSAQEQNFSQPCSEGTELGIGLPPPLEDRPVVSSPAALPVMKGVRLVLSSKSDGVSPSSPHTSRPHTQSPPRSPSPPADDIQPPLHQPRSPPADDIQPLFHQPRSPPADDIQLSFHQPHSPASAMLNASSPNEDEEGSPRVTSPSATISRELVVDFPREESGQSKEASAVLVHSRSQGDDDMRSHLAVEGQSLREMLSLLSEHRREALQQQEAAEARMCQQFERLLARSRDEQERMMTEHASQNYQQMERLNKELKAQEKQRMDKMTAAVSTSMQGKLEKIVKSEMKGVVLPSLSRSLSTISDQMNTTLAQKAESGVKDTVSKVVKSKAFSEAIAANLASSLQPTVQAKFEESFSSLLTRVTSSFEQSCAAMCQQVNTAFSAGTAQYLEHLQQHLSAHQQGVAAGQDAWRDRMVEAVGQANTAYLEAQRKTSGDLQVAMKNDMKQIMQSVSDTMVKLPDVMAFKVNECFDHNLHRFLVDSDQLKEQQKTEARQKAKSDIDHLLRTQQVGKAFDLALTNSDLPLVLHICKQVDPEEMFDQQTAAIAQPVLLSLVHHLASELSEDLDLKLKYIEHCLLAIDESDTMVREHIPNVLGHLVQSLSTKEKSLTTKQPTKARQLRRLRMLAERLAQVK